MRLSKADVEHYRNCADQYSKANGGKPIEVSEAVRWAMDSGKLDLSPNTIFEIHRQNMAVSLREDTTTDDQGNKVRLRYCVETNRRNEEGKMVQRYLWSHLEDATPSFLLKSFVQMRSKIRDDIQALKANLNFVNAYLAKKGKRPIQMDLDFNSEEPPDLGKVS